MTDQENYFKNLSYYKRITKDREKELSKIICNSRNKVKIEKARTELIQSNLSLVISRATKYMLFYHGSLSLMDLIAEGNLGLLRAARRRFDTSKASFGTYAIVSIDRHIKNAIKLDSLIRIPSGYFKYIWQLTCLKEKYGDKLTNKIVMEKLGISRELLSRLKLAIMSRRTMYLEDIRNVDGETIWEEIIADEKAESPINKIQQKTVIAYLNRYISKLTPRQQEVLNISFFESENPTYRDLGLKLGVSRVRARQLYFAALRNLRNLFSNDSGAMIDLGFLISKGNNYE